MRVEKKAMWVENNCLKKQKYAASVNKYRKSVKNEECHVTLRDQGRSGMGGSDAIPRKGGKFTVRQDEKFLEWQRRVEEKGVGGEFEEETKGNPLFSFARARKTI